jgi:hypothetical protein
VECVSPWVWINFENAIFGIRTEYVLLRVRICLSPRRNRSDLDAIRNEETTVKPKTKGSNEISRDGDALFTFSPGKEFRGA